MASAFHGGLKLDGHKSRSTQAPLRAATVPDELILLLDQHAGAAATPIVTPGERVLLGQPIAEPGGDLSAWLHSPVSGTIIATESVIVIANDGRDARYDHSPVDYQTLDAAHLREHIARGGIVGLGGAVFPTAAKLAHAQGREVHLLLNGAECEPWISCDDLLMREHAADVLLGARILRHAVGASKCTLVLEDDMPLAIAALRAALGADDTLVIDIQPDRYPAGGERQMILAVTGQEVPHDGLPADIGVLVQNVATAAAVARWLRDGEPLIRRIVTLTGSGVREPANLDARLGTPVAGLIADCGGCTDDVAQLLMGGSMMGIALDDDSAPLVKAMNCVVAAAAQDLQPRGIEMPCIRCGDCAQACPAQLLPQQLHGLARADDLAGLAKLGLMACIECGCCDYVCPSQIPLTQRFRAAKIPLRAALLAHSDAQAARARYEARDERLARIEREQRAKLEEKRRQLTGRRP